MYAYQQTVKMQGFEIELIPCPRQPGNLQISRQACALRYLKAQKMADKKSNAFGNGSRSAQRWSLEICKTCPDGQRCAEDDSFSERKKL
jgi:hypothetical protein